MGAAAVLAMAAPAFSATPDSWAKNDKASELACIKAANLTDSTAGPPIRFSDKMLIDARVIDGVWPQAHMAGAKARMLCLYNRKTKKVEIQELPAPAMKVVSYKDIWWRAENVGGNAVVDRSEITLMLGSDGKIGGNSGCNGYSANYQITGDTIKVYPPMIGTRMACSPALMSQEQTFQKFVENASSLTVLPDGGLVMKTADGATSRFIRK